MGYDPAIHEARAPASERRYVDDYAVPLATERLELGVERWRKESALATARRHKLVKQARADVERWTREGRDIVTIVADLYILLEAATRRKEPPA